MIPDPNDHGTAAEPPHYAGHTPGYGPNPTAQGVRGYRDLQPEEVALINQLKEMQEAVADAWARVFVRPDTDRRKANIARTHFEEGFSALVGSIARPHDPFMASLGALEKAKAQQYDRDHSPATEGGNPA